MVFPVPLALFISVYDAVTTQLFHVVVVVARVLCWLVTLSLETFYMLYSVVFLVC